MPRQRLEGRRDRKRVSIPCWVFSVPRPGIGEIHCGGSGFQSPAGFSRCRDCRELSDTEQDVVFQSPAGFSRCRDRCEQRALAASTCFNPLLGFLGAATCGGRPSRRQRTVSIPCWVFSVPRRQRAIADPLGSRVSIPCWVFSVPRPLGAGRPSRSAARFQSPAGFSRCRD